MPRRHRLHVGCRAPQAAGQAVMLHFTLYLACSPRHRKGMPDLLLPRTFGSLEIARSSGRSGSYWYAVKATTCNTKVSHTVTQQMLAHAPHLTPHGVKQARRADQRGPEGSAPAARYNQPRSRSFRQLSTRFTPRTDNGHAPLLNGS